VRCISGMHGLRLDLPSLGEDYSTPNPAANNLLLRYGCPWLSGRVEEWFEADTEDVDDPCSDFKRQTRLDCKAELHNFNTLQTCRL
jgi:hypothetical protein